METFSDAAFSGKLPAWRDKQDALNISLTLLKAAPCHVMVANMRKPLHRAGFNMLHDMGTQAWFHSDRFKRCGAKSKPVDLM